MKDTPPEFEAKFERMIMRRSGEERLKMGCSMHASSRELIKASIGDTDPAALKKALFLRFYGDEFGPKERKKILLALTEAAGPKRTKPLSVRDASKQATRKPLDPMNFAAVRSSQSGTVRKKGTNLRRKQRTSK